VRDVVLAFAFLEMHQVQAMRLHVTLDVCDERIGDRLHEH